jgi:3-hydroxyacyl-CoA dehydrogenase/enoyl-CoA hydratase/3-hydroxybutyryl-CoA epimerase
MAREWIAAHPAPKQPWDEEAFRMPGGGPSNPKVSQMLSIAPAMVVEKTRGLYPAPKAIMAAMVEGAYVDVDTALRIESRYLAKLAVGQVAKNLITLFFHRTAIKSGASRPKDVPKWKATKVGILGAGMMGGGIAWANASRAVPCVLKDVTLEKAQAGKSYTERLLERRKKDKNPLLLIKASADARDLAGCDLIIEAVFEKRELKAQVTKEAEPFLAPGGIFASNTSTLPITSLAETAKDASRFIGIHFFSPVERMMLVEIILGKKTGDVALAAALDYVRMIRKTPIVVNDARGFYAYRCVLNDLLEGHLMLMEGVPPAMIENCARMAGMPVGPLSLNDEVALDLAWKILKAAEADLGPKAINPLQKKLLQELVEKHGRYGRKNGKGFYDYPQSGPKRLWPGLVDLQPKRLDPDKLDVTELKQRFLVTQALEAARTFEEGVVTDVREADVGSILGFGFAPFSGGTLSYIDMMGTKKFVELCKALEKRHGPRFKPSQLLLDLAAKGDTFYRRFPPDKRKAA